MSNKKVKVVAVYHRPSIDIPWYSASEDFLRASEDKYGSRRTYTKTESEGGAVLTIEQVLDSIELHHELLSDPASQENILKREEYNTKFGIFMINLEVTEID
jgi:hypothetical protein